MKNYHIEALINDLKLGAKDLQYADDFHLICSVKTVHTCILALGDFPPSKNALPQLTCAADSLLDGIGKGHVWRQAAFSDALNAVERIQEG